MCYLCVLKCSIIVGFTFVDECMYARIQIHKSSMRFHAWNHMVLYDNFMPFPCMESHGIIWFHAWNRMESYRSMHGIAWNHMVPCMESHGIISFHAWNRMESYGSMNRMESYGII